jgi:hypothetical protein
MLRLIAIVSALMSVSVMAQTPPRGGNPACTPLKNACIKAGYSMTEPPASEKSVIGGCMAKYARGETAKGITMKPTDKAIASCISFMKMKMAQISGKPGPARGIPRTGTNGQGKTTFSGNSIPPRTAKGVRPKTPTPAPSKTTPKPGGK